MPHTDHHKTRLQRAARSTVTAITVALGAIAAVPALAQTATYAPFQGPVRAFPNHAFRGTLVVTSLADATIDGNKLLLAPAFKLYNPQNMAVRPNTMLDQKLTVNYVIENSTGMLITAWILTQGEAEQPRKGSDTVERNYRTEYDVIRK